MSTPTKFKLGQTVRDKITGMTGVITCIAEFMHSGNRICVTPKKQLPKEDSDVWLDEQRLEVKGVATARFYHINGCLQVEISPTELKDGRPIKSWAFDEQRLVVKGKRVQSQAGPGGPSIRCPSRSSC